MSEILQIPRKGEPWREYNFAFGTGFMRGHGYTKGWCFECQKWKLFHIDRVQASIQLIYAMGSMVPIAENQGDEYYGTCTNGHSDAFYPWTRPESKQWKRDATELAFRPITADDRGPMAKKYYEAWKNFSFRRPEIEDHYTRGHECDEECPEYEWYDW